MGSGHGSTQRAILALLVDGQVLTIHDLSRAIFRPRIGGLPTEGELVTVRRAVRTLEAEGIIESRRVMGYAKVPIEPDAVPMPDPVTFQRGWQWGQRVWMKAVRLRSERLDAAAG